MHSVLIVDSSDPAHRVISDFNAKTLVIIYYPTHHFGTETIEPNRLYLIGNQLMCIV